MKLRKLENKDAFLMLEWMHDKDVIEHMQTEFKKNDVNDCRAFISKSLTDNCNVHMAIVDDKDIYLGTVSLKHINLKYSAAEFAIVVRKCAMGTGISKEAMKTILQMGKQQLRLKNIYWCVNDKNTRALRFYDKNNYQKTVEVPEFIKNKYRKDQLKNLVWYIYG